MACLTPFNVTNLKNEQVPVPCGKCMECKKRRVSAWSFRLMQEYKVSQSAYFITLTYDTAHVPITNHGFMSLSKRDVQLFFKRLRKAHGQTSCIKYYAAGEYGEDTMRPHYHVILFNAKIEKISPAWGLGHVHYGQVTEASVGYTLKYICKDSIIPLHDRDDRQKEFPLMSKGLGKNYLTKAMIAWHKASPDRMYCNLLDGKKIAMPRYYKDKIYTDWEREVALAYQMDKLFEVEMKERRELGDNYKWVKTDLALAKMRRYKKDTASSRHKL